MNFALRQWLFTKFWRIFLQLLEKFEIRYSLQELNYANIEEPLNKMKKHSSSTEHQLGNGYLFAFIELFQSRVRGTISPTYLRSLSFYACRSQKCKKTDNLTVFFTLLGSTRVKAVRRTLMKFSPCLNRLLAYILTWNMIHNPLVQGSLTFFAPWAPKSR